MDDDPPSPLEWPGLLAAAQAGAEWAWARLYRQLAAPVRGYLRAHGAADPDDLLGDVWLQVARNIGRFEGGPDAFRSWVFVVAHHRIVDDRRYRRRRPTADADGTEIERGAGTADAAEDDALDRLGTEAVVGLLAQLTDDQRDVLTLRLIGDLTIDQVAEALDKRPGAVKALQRRGLASIRRLMEGVPL
ncbi:MAG: sigma-70 family RNA polymerase sigma factor [Acidimicrobiia bacterium]